jgi:hypothetical protein
MLAPPARRWSVAGEGAPKLLVGRVRAGYDCPSGGNGILRRLACSREGGHFDAHEEV